METKLAHKRDCTRKNRGLCECDPSFNSAAWKTEPTHTPTPWHLNADPQYIQDQYANIVAVIHARLDGKRNAEIELEGKANAAFIVRAVNSHEALLEVQQRAEELADVVRNGGNYRQAVEWFDEANKAYIAIAQAEVQS